MKKKIIKRFNMNRFDFLLNLINDNSIHNKR